MPVSNGRFSKPIRLKEDLANFFGLSANLGNIIVNGNINKWAKYKPVVLNSFAPDRNSDWWKGSSGLCGFDEQGTASLSELCEGYNNGTFWKYVKPSGGSSSPFRALDFDNYNHYAVPFIRSNITKGSINKIAANSVQRFTFNVNTGTDGSLSVSDFQDPNMTLGTNARICASIFFNNPLTSIPTSASQYTFYSEKVLGDKSSISIDVEIGDYTRRIFILFYMQDETTTYRYTPIPYDDNNYILAIFDVTSNPADLDGYSLEFDEVYFYVYGVEFTNYVKLNQFSPSMENHKVLKLQDAGDFRLTVHVSNGNIKNFVFNDNNEIYLTIDNKSLIDFHIYSINGNSNISYPYTLSKNTAVDIELRGNGTYVLPQLTDGVKDFKLYRNGYRTSIISQQVDIDFYPFQS